MIEPNQNCTSFTGEAQENMFYIFFSQLQKYLWAFKTSKTISFLVACWEEAAYNWQMHHITLQALV